MEKNDYSKSRKYEVFANLLLHGLESTYCNFSTFTANHLLEIKTIEKDLIEFAKIHYTNYELEDLINYSKETQFFENYFNSNDGDSKILENINWYLKKGESMLNYNDSLRPDELAAFFENIIYFSFLKPPRKQKKTTYVWQSNPNKELPDLYRLMIDKYKLIAPETTAEQFKAIFTGQSIESIKPIKWTDSNRLLAYFLDSVFNGQNWQSIAGNGGLFLNKKGLKISANDLSVAKKGYIDFGKPKDYEKIDLILKTIKKHLEH